MLLIALLAQAATEAPHAAAQAGGIGAIGLDWRALLFQVINFAILLFLLRLFAYKPILKILEQRRQTIEESLQTAAEVATAKEQLVAEKERVLADVHRQAQQIVSQSKQQAAELIRAAEEKAAERAAATLEQAQAKLAQEVAEVKTKLRQETLLLVRLACEQILQEKLDAKTDNQLIESALQRVQVKS